ncbi:hypothetical protein ACJX0J_037029, partial [Zea mays]
MSEIKGIPVTIHYVMSKLFHSLYFMANCDKNNICICYLSTRINVWSLGIRPYNLL